MNALRAVLRRLLQWLEPGSPAGGPIPDQIEAHLRAAVAADEWAKARNVETYEARVKAMIDDFFTKYGDRNGQHHP